MDVGVTVCPSCGEENRMPEGRAGTPVCAACGKPLDDNLTVLKDPPKAKPVRAPSGLALTTRLTSFIAAVREPTKNPMQATSAGLAGLLLLVMVIKLISGPPPAARVACDKGDMEACVALGFLYEQDVTLQDGLEEAAALYVKACEGGSDNGCRALYQLFATHPERALACKSDQTRCLDVKANLED